MNDFSKEVERLIGRHFVGLSCVQYPSANSQTINHMFSGFVIEVIGEWFYITAGHILKAIRTELQNGSKFDIWRLCDQTAGKRFGNFAIPYLFESEKWIVPDNGKNEFDLAVVPIRDLFRQQLEANGIIAIPKIAWDTHRTNHDDWVLYGSPSESLIYDGKTSIKTRIVFAPLIPVKEPVDVASTAKKQFYAKLVEGSERFISDLDGMSGAPVFAIKKESDTCKYFVIGVQSGWYPSKKVLTICPFLPLGLALERIVQEEFS